MSIARATTLLFLLAILMVFFAMSGFSVLRHGGTGMRIRRRCESVRPRLVIRALVASMHFLAATATGALACLVVVRTGLLNSFQGNWDIVAAALASIGASFVAIAKPEYFAEGIGKSHPDMSSADMEKLLRIVRILGFLSLPVVSAICFVAVRAVVG